MRPAPNWLSDVRFATAHARPPLPRDRVNSEGWERLRLVERDLSLFLGEFEGDDPRATEEGSD